MSTTLPPRPEKGSDQQSLTLPGPPVARDQLFEPSSNLKNNGRFPKGPSVYFYLLTVCQPILVIERSQTINNLDI